jgi:NAD(P)-dependent dehydrogenase (short-subunit alcohol dehydrogenase family)
VTDGASIASAVEQVVALDGLVNNAGVAVPGPLEFLPIEDLRHVLDVNVVGQLAVTQAFLPKLRESRGRIVFMSSVAGMLAAPLFGPYAASKFALEALADALRMELASSGVQVSVVEPANIVTPIWAKGRALRADFLDRAPEAESRYGRLIERLQRMSYAVERHGEPPDVVAVAVAHALLAPRPRTRYLVGRGASFMPFMRLIPDRLRDRLVLRSFGA